MLSVARLVIFWRCIPMQYNCQKSSNFHGLSHFSRIFGKNDKIPGFFQAGKTVTIFPGFPEAVGTLVTDSESQSNGHKSFFFFFFFFFGYEVCMAYLFYKTYPFPAFVTQHISPVGHRRLLLKAKMSVEVIMQSQMPWNITHLHSENQCQWVKGHFVCQLFQPPTESIWFGHFVASSTKLLNV